VSGAAQPVVIEDLDAVLIIRLFPEAAGISDGEAKALAQGIATMEAGALLVSSQYEPVPGSGPAAPVATAPPVNVDIPFVGQTGETLSCTMGNWTNEPTSYAYAWMRDGMPMGTNIPTYTVAPGDVGMTATCVVTATNAAGSTAAPSSNGVVIAAP
jgi:hypothetical protein